MILAVLSDPTLNRYGGELFIQAMSFTGPKCPSELKQLHKLVTCNTELWRHIWCS